MELKDIFYIAKGIEDIVRKDPKWFLHERDGQFFLTHKDSGDNLVIRNAEHFKEVTKDLDIYLEKVDEEMKHNGQMDVSNLMWKK